MREFEVQVGTESRVESWVVSQTKGYRSVVDFGAGRFGYLLAVPCESKVGIEFFRPYVDDFVARHPGSDVVATCGDMRKFRELIRGDHDVAMFIDSLEHIKKHEGEKLIRECQECFKKIIVFGPLGFHPNEAVDGNKFNLHLAKIEKGDLEELGFVVDVDPEFHVSSRPQTPSAFYAVWERS